VQEQEKKVRTLFLTYEADEDTADTFMIVLGSIAENFRGVDVVDYQDDRLFAEDRDPKETLHELMTSRLSNEQRQELEAFASQLQNWEGEES
jgi:hypothetical protein